MNKEIKEILELAKQLEDASNYNLADNLTASLVKLAQLAGAPTLKPLPTRPIITEPISPLFEPTVAPTPKSSTSLNPFQFILPGSVEKFNKNVELIKLPENQNTQRVNNNEKSRNDERAKKAVQVWRLIKKPNNIYSDYVQNSKDEKLKELNSKIKSIKEEEISYFIKNMKDESAFTPSVKNKARDIMHWAFKMHIINSIPPVLGLSGYSRSGAKPGQKVQDKKPTKTEIKTKTEGRSLPTTPTLPTTPERVKEEETVRPSLIPDMPVLPKSPAITSPLESPVFPDEDDGILLTPDIMTPILSPKRETRKEEETSYGPMTWDQFLYFLNPNKTPGRDPSDTPLDTKEPSKVGVNDPFGTKPPTSTQEATKQNKEKPSNTQIPLKMDLPPMKEAPAGGISFMRSFR
jgi:hypothetical protein